MDVRNIAAIFLLTTRLADGEGVVVHKEQEFHANDSATPLRFDEVNPKGFVTWFSSSGKTLRFEATQWFRYIEFPPPLIEAIDPKILPTRIKQLESLENFSAQFRKSSTLLEQVIARVRLDTENLKNGLVLHNKVWISRADYEASQQQKADEIKRKLQEVASQEESEIARIKLKSELQSKRLEELRVVTEERRAVKIQDLRDKIGDFSAEKSTIQLENKILREELLNIVNRENIDSGK